MRSDPRQAECLVLYFVDDQDIPADVKFTILSPFTFQRMIMCLWRQGRFLQQQSDILHQFGKMVVRNYLYFQALSQHLRQVYQAQGDSIAIYVYPAGISF